MDRVPSLAADLVRRRVAVIVTSGSLATVVAKAATTIPIVFASGMDPVALGLVANLNRPGANVTGISNLQAELAPKQLQLLRELMPNVARFGLLADPAFPATPSMIASLQAAAATLGRLHAIRSGDVPMAPGTGLLEPCSGYICTCHHKRSTILVIIVVCGQIAVSLRTYIIQ
jgi:putative tryptophan/tyrosine transport system substrate-binding protein